MTLTGLPGDPAVVSMDGQRLDIFARAPDDTLWHIWLGTGDDGAESLGGQLAGDPVAVAGPNSIDVFAREFGFWMRTWRWSPVERRMMEADVRWHDWRIVHDPVAVRMGAGIAVYVASATDELLRFWTADGSNWDAPQVLGECRGPLAVLERNTGVPDVFGRDPTNGGLLHWGTVHVFGSSADRFGSENLGGTVASTPVVVSWSDDRMDIVASGTDGTALHWGWAGKQKYYDTVGDGKVWHTGRWYGAEASVPGQFGPEAAATSAGRDLAELYARAVDGTLQRWSWDGTAGWDPYGSWAGPTNLVGGLGSNPAAIGRNNRAELYAWEQSTGHLLQIFPAGGQWVRNSIPITLRTRPGPELPPARVTVNPDYVVVRPDDLAIVGVNWTGYDLADGDPPTLQRTGADARLVLALPPQHIGEEVSPAGGTLVAPVDGDNPLFARWRAVLSGPSRLVFAPTAERIELTAEGLLAAVQNLPVISDGDSTRLEVPWQLTVAPNNAGSEHSSVVADGSVVALWRAIMRPLAGTAMTLVIKRATGSDPFALPLGRGARELLVDKTADLHRLELSALGATLSARGSWDSTEWEHDTTLGRDQRVRVQLRGILYPFGHAAVYTEFTERFPGDGENPIAVLRKRSSLTVTQPTREYTSAPIAGFPFDSVEIATVQLTDLDDPDLKDLWTNYTWPPRPSEEVAEQLQDLLDELAAQPIPPGDWAAGMPVMEHLINAVDDLGPEGEPDELELAAAQTNAAATYLGLVEAIQRVQEEIDALAVLQTATPPWFFWPTRSGERVPFTVRLDSASGPVEITLPLLFVVDVNVPESPAMTAFDSLRDQDAATRFATEWATPGAPSGNRPAGVVDIGGRTLDLVRSGDPAATGDHQVVQRLNIFAATDGERGFRPRLGLPQSDSAWAVEIDLPTARTLLPDKIDAHTARVRYSDAFEQAGVAVDVAYTVIGAAIDLDFTRSADRSGGLISPSIAADGLSRTAGLVNTAGFSPLEPAKLFKDGAKLLGFSLADLIKDLPTGPDGPGAPVLATDLSTIPPTVRMAWTDVPLTKAGPFGPIVDEAGQPVGTSVLTMSVESSGATTKTECTITSFALSFPTSSPLLTLTFDRMHYVQRDGQAPQLDIDGLMAHFHGALDVLQALQDKIVPAGKGIQVHADAAGITASYTLPVPDAESGAFIMRGLSFHAAVVVPFGGDPVTVALGFASREKPFNLSVMLLGGGGYVDLELAHDGLRRLEISLEFGASVAVSFAIASGEAHVLGGIRFELLPDKSVQLTGFLRIGGSLDVLGLVSVSVELLLTLGYETTGNRLVGRATLIIEIDVTLFSDSVELDSGEWVIAGDDAPSADPAPPALLRPGPPPSGLLADNGPELFISDEPDPFLLAWLEHSAAFEAR